MIGVVPVQVPFVVVSVEPTLSSPLIVGGAVFDRDDGARGLPGAGHAEHGSDRDCGDREQQERSASARLKVVMRVMRLPLSRLPGKSYRTPLTARGKRACQRPR